jgi:hypothetical protein
MLKTSKSWIIILVANFSQTRAITTCDSKQGHRREEQTIATNACETVRYLMEKVLMGLGENIDSSHVGLRQFISSYH